MKFHCIHCGQRIEATDEQAGTDATCPACGGAITVPKSQSKKQLPALSVEQQDKLKQQEELAAKMKKEADQISAEQSKLEAENSLLEQARAAELAKSNANKEEKAAKAKAILDQLDQTANNEQQVHHQPPKHSTEKRAIPWRLIVILSIGFILLISKIHIISGGGVGFKIVIRESFGFSELFINVDQITGMPWIAAQSRFPLGCRVLARERIIESASEFKERTTREVQKQIDDAMQDAQKEYEKLMRDIEYGN